MMPNFWGEVTDTLAKKYKLLQEQIPFISIIYCVWYFESKKNFLTYNMASKHSNAFLYSELCGVAVHYLKTSTYWIASNKKTNVYKGTRGSWRSVIGPNEMLKEPLSFCTVYLWSLVFVDLIRSANCEIKAQMVAIQAKLLAKLNFYRS